MTKLKMYHKDPCYSGINLYNNLPHAIRKLSENVKLFKEALRDFLLKQSFCTLEEYFNYKTK